MGCWLADCWTAAPGLQRRTQPLPVPDTGETKVRPGWPLPALDRGRALPAGITSVVDQVSSRLPSVTDLDSCFYAHVFQPNSVTKLLTWSSMTSSVTVQVRSGRSTLLLLLFFCHPSEFADVQREPRAFLPDGHRTALSLNCLQLLNANTLWLLIVLIWQLLQALALFRSGRPISSARLPLS